MTGRRKPSTLRPCTDGGWRSSLVLLTCSRRGPRSMPRLRSGLGPWSTRCSMIPRNPLRLTAYDRAYILPRASRQETRDPPRPPGRRRIARGKHLLALAVVTRPRLGEPLLCAAVARAVWSRGHYRIVEWE